jgi:hypothetical protein
MSSKESARLQSGYWRRFTTAVVSNARYVTAWIAGSLEKREKLITVGSEAVQAIFAVCGTIAAVFIALAVNNLTIETARIEYERAISEALTAVDAVVMSSDEKLKILDSIMAKERKPAQGIELRRKRQIGYMHLNVLATAFTGVNRGFTDKRGLSNIDAQLEIFLYDDDIYSLSQTGVFQVGFAEHCRELRARNSASQK